MESEEWPLPPASPPSPLTEGQWAQGIRLAEYLPRPECLLPPVTAAVPIQRTFCARCLITCLISLKLQVRIGNLMFSHGFRCFIKIT